MAKLGKVRATWDKRQMLDRSRRDKVEKGVGNIPLGPGLLSRFSVYTWQTIIKLEFKKIVTFYINLMSKQKNQPL